MTPGRGRVAIVTGAANGIGRATALEMAARGYRLGLIDRDPARLAEVAGRVETAGVEACAAEADVVDPAAIQAAVDAVEAVLGPCDVLVACAGVGRMTHVPDLDTAGLRAMLEVNVLGMAQSFEAVLPGMIGRGRGHLVGISSVAGLRGMPWMASYSASKAAVWTYLEGLRPALKRRGVRITTVFPGFVRTGMTLDVPFARPVTMLEPEQAAVHIVRAIEKGSRDYMFPWLTALGMGFLRRSPNRLYDWMMDRAGPKALTTDF
ncbi:SDR family NAD(P)-dependent oxidoreductase [Planctomyces sp. SH-PL62]|uniref:SDR family NAD(P)-dependent oxidoreductase n=1 Tax=Planctomyces sp. SH-PL62 TaxID=1636152 RepID=UPI00078C6948|nr:SDR family NAD(P)-dependent oxidoreductase [Planctomyces sp. SH-PL62]AMV38760.1 Putative oxidoreductase SadH [Planctomyces sp. SH-PL62]